MGRNNKGGAKPPSKRGNAKPDGNAAADAKVAKEVEELRNKSIKSFKKGSTAKATRSTPSSNVDPFVRGKVSDARTLFLQAFKDMANAIKQLPRDPLNYMVRAALFHELEQVCCSGQSQGEGQHTCAFFCEPRCGRSADAMQFFFAEKPASERREVGPGNGPAVLARLLL